MKYSLPTSGGKTTFIYDSLSFSMLGCATWSLSLRTAGYRNQIPLTDMLGMANLIDEITAMPEVWVSLFLSLVSGGRITAQFYPSNGAWCMSWHWNICCEEALMPMYEGVQMLLSLFWMLVLLGQWIRTPVKGQRYDFLLFFRTLHMRVQFVRCIPYYLDYPHLKHRWCQM